MLNGYTYSQDHHSRSYYCSKKGTGCKASVKLDEYGRIKSASSTHTHKPPRYLQMASDFNYHFIPSQTGRKSLLMVNGYTFSQDHYSTSYYCSKKGSGCKAFVKFTKDGHVRASNISHKHKPPTYMTTSTGQLVKLQ